MWPSTLSFSSSFDHRHLLFHCHQDPSPSHSSATSSTFLQVVNGGPTQSGPSVTVCDPGPSFNELLNVFSAGEINSFTIFGQTVIVINSLDVARDVLINRSAIYSDRPRLVMGGELCGWDRTTVLAPYGSKLKGHRLLFSRGISAKRSLEKYHSVMEHVARSFASGLASDSTDLIGQTHRYVYQQVSYRELEHTISRSVADLQLAVIYDYTVQGKEDPLVNDTETVLRYFTMILEPGAFLVDTLPFRESFYLNYGVSSDADTTQ